MQDASDAPLAPRRILAGKGFPAPRFVPMGVPNLSQAAPDAPSRPDATIPMGIGGAGPKVLTEPSLRQSTVPPIPMLSGSYYILTGELTSTIQRH